MKRLRDSVYETFSHVVGQVIIVLGAFGFATILLLLTGYDPTAAARGMWRGVTDLGGLLRWSIPLILAGLAVSAAFRTGMFNLGIDGQLYLGSVSATFVGLSLGQVITSGPVLILLAVVAGVVAGMIWAAIPALLRLKWNASEVVTTLMLNFIALYFTDYLVLGPMRGTGAIGTSYSSDIIPDVMWLRVLVQGSKATTAIIVAVILAIVLFFLFRRTSLGYEFTVVGTSRKLAMYGGIRWKRVLFVSMLLSGAIAGLVGVIEVLGVHYRFAGRFNHGIGFNGIVVSLVANHNPIGVIFSGVFFAALRNGARYMERIVDVPRAMVEIVEGMIVLAIGAKLLWRKRRRK